MANAIKTAKIEGYTDHGVRDLLSAEIDRAGSQTAAARSLGISTAYLGDVLHGRRPVSAQMADRLALKRVVVFVREN